MDLCFLERARSATDFDGMLATAEDLFRLAKGRGAKDFNGMPRIDALGRHKGL
jgi:hypothetical protein